MKTLFVVLALICFLCCAFGIAFGPAHLGWLGLTFLCISFLPLPN